jgi:sialate O-acetylesterase
MPRLDRNAVAAAICVLSASQADARDKTPLLYPLFQDHAVIERDQPAPIWGTAKPGAKVAVTIDGNVAETTADASGHWSAMLPAHAAGGPFTLTAKATPGKSQTIKDVLYGDVWLCSGQSNMELQVRYTTNAYTETHSGKNENIRLLTVHRASSAAPLESLHDPVAWSVAAAGTVDDFSAVCYYFGREMEKATHVPVGLIHSSWGGSTIQAWLSPGAAHTLGNYEDGLATLAAYAHSPDAATAHWRDFLKGWWATNDPGSRATPAWYGTATDDAAWTPVKLEGFWETWGVPALKSFDGTVWFRTHVTLTADQAKSAATLSLGPADDVDSTWINDAYIGGSEGWDVDRTYTLAPNTFHPGDNLIAVGVLDTGGGGGLWGPLDKKNLRFADGTTVPLASWRYRISAPLATVGSAPHAPWGDATGLTTLYDGMIAPLTPYGLKGVLWYQGEANTGEAHEYARLLPALMADWRNDFHSPQLPFLIVQLAGFGPANSAPDDSAWASLREVQRRSVEADPRAGLAVAIDIGDRYDIHPTNKQEVARRLALVARHKFYGETVEDSGPVPMSAARKGRSVILQFTHAEPNLVVYGSNRPVGFELCDAGKRCVFVDATAAKDTVTLDVPAKMQPVSVRFCWGDSPVCNLYNSANLPAVPFEMPIALPKRRHG